MATDKIVPNTYVYTMILNILMVTLLQLRVAFAQDPYEVEFKDQQETCVYFQLEIEELQTFTSYTVTQQDREVQT